MPKPKEKRLPKRVSRIIEACQAGEKLCRWSVTGKLGAHEVMWSLYPSERTVGPASAQRAIETGLLVASNDSLFGNPFDSQTWAAA